MLKFKNILNIYKTSPFKEVNNSGNIELLRIRRKFSSTVNSENKIKENVSININTERELHNNEVFDTVIVGGGVTGTALLFLLSKFTNLKKLALIERRDNFALVASHGKNNSQTIHCGDIETNYTFEKAKFIKRYADLLRNYLTKLPKEKRDDISSVTQKMVLGVGEKECQFLEERYPTFRQLFKSMKLYNIEDIHEVEPRVALKDAYTLREEKLSALYMPPELTTCDYQKLAQSFIESSKNVDKNISINLLTEVINIEEINDSLYKIYTNKGTIKSRFVVVCACGHSLMIAQKMNYGLEYSCMPVAGSFYFTDYILNGKVYTIQNPALPFAAVHGDPDIIEKGRTRFGPTALPLPLLERDNIKTFKDFLKVWNPDINLFHVYYNLFKDMTMLKYVARNFLFEIPILNKYLFLKDVRKIIPTLTKQDLTYCVGYGGVRPQLINKKSKKLLLGEGKIDSGKNIIFNITPSPGATTCLGNGEFDMNTVCERLNAVVKKDEVRKFLYEGEYPVNYL
ncbi:malate:quinone oxidoreductase, putative [Plasmodium gallinaceum]|uniref:Malate:quinone oxidoreductase, putative n=1 Tax=Plasmodium gallinaceum TaxID=5849 RepID=A0A1J1GMU0_PLAGA|nr:malate:quinone oxidoreductase, putative [Plasmodium gallinaceum]CRG93750.1 malate:quinone oxidoreductase, putative [Plasmodium gallinaceum]